MLTVISAVQMCAQTLTDVLVEWHQATLKQQNPCDGQAEGECFFAGIVASLPASLGDDSAWQYFIDHGLQACTTQLGFAAQQTVHCLLKAGGHEMPCAVRHADMKAILRVLSKFWLHT